MRRLAEIRRQARHYADLCEYDEQSGLLHRVEFHNEQLPDEAEFEAMMARRRELEATHGVAALEVHDDYEAGVINGYRDALLWVLGDGHDDADL